MSISNNRYVILFIMNMGIGSVTPPVGSCLFVGCGIAKVGIEGVTKYIVKMFAAMVVALLLRWIQNGIFQPRFTINSANNDNTVTQPWMYEDKRCYTDESLMPHSHFTMMTDIRRISKRESLQRPKSQ